MGRCVVEVGARDVADDGAAVELELDAGGGVHAGVAAKAAGAFKRQGQEARGLVIDAGGDQGVDRQLVHGAGRRRDGAAGHVAAIGRADPREVQRAVCDFGGACEIVVTRKRDGDIKRGERDGHGLPGEEIGAVGLHHRIQERGDVDGLAGA